jgi:hypothetical protein
MSRSYKRDAKGRFAGGGGGGRKSAKPVTLTARKPGGKNRGGGHLLKKQAVKDAKAKLKAKDAADTSIKGTLSRRAQKGAVTRAANALKAAQQTGRVRLSGRSGVIRPGARKAGKKAKKKTPQTSGQSFERRMSRVTPASAEARRMRVESTAPMQFFAGRSGGKAENAFRNRVSQASYNRQVRSRLVADRARQFYAAASQFRSSFTERPRYSTRSNRGKGSMGPWSLGFESAWAGYRGRGSRKRK